MPQPKPQAKKPKDAIVGYIYETRNYEQFEVAEFNREVTHTWELEESMEKYGWLRSLPAYCVPAKTPGKLLIKDGHRRYYIAQKRDKPVVYTIARESIAVPIPDLNLPTRLWSAAEYGGGWENEGKPDYRDISRFRKDTGISLSMALGLFAGDLGPGNHMADFKRGRYTIRDQNHAHRVGRMVKALTGMGYKFATSGTCVFAISRILAAPQFNADKFLAKIAKNPFLFTQQPTLEAYETMVEKAVNYRTANELPLKVLVHQAVKARRHTTNGQATHEATP